MKTKMFSFEHQQQDAIWNVVTKQIHVASLKLFPMSTWVTKRNAFINIILTLGWNAAILGKTVGSYG